MGMGDRGSPNPWCPKARWALLSDVLLLPCSSAHGHNYSWDEGLLPNYTPELLPSCAGCLHFSRGSPSAWPMLCVTHSWLSVCLGTARAGQVCRSPTNAPPVAVENSWLRIFHGCGEATAPCPHRNPAGIQQGAGAGMIPPRAS